MMNDVIQEYRGKKVVIRFDTAKCIHSRNCVLGSPKVFVANAPDEWVQPDEDSPENRFYSLKAARRIKLFYHFPVYWMPSLPA
jgi:uncharacterized Fe-S cluster protein YjdI